MEEDWGLTANAPPFSLFRDGDPAEEAIKDSFVDIVVYNRWTKAQRRLYQKLKCEYIVRKIAEDKLKTMDDLSAALDSLVILKNDTEDEYACNVDDLINKVQDMKLQVSSRRKPKAKQEVDEKEDKKNILN